MLRCTGNEDLATQSIRRPALSRSLCSARDLVVDLSELDFADTSLMLDLAMVARRLRKAGATMRISGANPQVQTLMDMMGLHRLPSVEVLPSPAPVA